MARIEMEEIGLYSEDCRRRRSYINKGEAKNKVQIMEMSKTFFIHIVPTLKPIEGPNNENTCLLIIEGNKQLMYTNKRIVINFTHTHPVAAPIQRLDLAFPFPESCCEASSACWLSRLSWLSISGRATEYREYSIVYSPFP